jgi:hypothetical protein
MILRAATWENFRSNGPMFRSKTHRITVEVITQQPDVFSIFTEAQVLPGGHEGTVS